MKDINVFKKSKVVTKLNDEDSSNFSFKFSERCSSAEEEDSDSLDKEYDDHEEGEDEVQDIDNIVNKMGAL